MKLEGAGARPQGHWGATKVLLVVTSSNMSALVTQLHVTFLDRQSRS